MFTIPAGIILAGVVLGLLASAVVIAIGFSPRMLVVWVLLLVGAATVFVLAGR